MIIRHIRGPAERWAEVNPILKSGELGYEEGVNGASGKFKFGDSVTHWNDLEYFVTEDVLQQKIVDYITTHGGIGGGDTPVDPEDQEAVDALTAQFNTFKATYPIITPPPPPPEAG